MTAQPAPSAIEKALIHASAAITQDDSDNGARLLEQIRLNAAARAALAATMNRESKMHAALSVICLDPTISAWLKEHDPKALEQCRAARQVKA